jgi:hypothetical protein
VKPWERYAPAPSGPWERYASPAPYELEGGPLSTRLGVETARTPEDALATVRQRFPDAEMTEDGNFTFTDPATGKKTLLNKKGLDWGDVTMAARPLAEMAGAIPAGAAGFAAGGPVGAVAAAGAGGAAGGAALDAARAGLGLPQTWSGENVARDVTLNAAGEGASRAVMAGGRALARGVTRADAPATIAAAERAGVEPTATMVGGHVLSAPEQIATYTMPGSRPQRALDRLQQRTTEILDQARPQTPMNPQTVPDAVAQAGAAVKKAAGDQYNIYKQARLTADNQFFNQMPANVKFRLPRVRQYAAQLRAEAARRPGDADIYAPVLREVERLEANMAANGGALPADLVRQARTLLGEQLDTEATTQLTGTAQRELSNLYHALGADLKNTAKVTAPAAGRALERHDRLVKAFRGSNLGVESAADSLNAVLKSKSDEAAWQALNSSTGGTRRLGRLVSRMPPDQRAIVARATWDRMMTTAAGNPVSPMTWATKWQQLPPASRQLMFGNITDVGQLDALATVMRAQAGGMGTMNRSFTEYTRELSQLLKSVIGGGAALAGGAGFAGAFPSAPATLISYILAEGATHPWAIKKLVEIANRAGATGRAGTAARTVGQAAVQTVVPPAADFLGGP